jgi:tRNA (guanine-N(7)-)-methyltransferase
VQIYFPDPWPKARHHKRRIVQRAFTDLIWRKLRAGGEIHCATDWENYAEWMRDVFAGDPKWQNLGSADGFAPRPDWRPQTKFERRGERLGHGVWDLRYCKTEA